MRIMFVCGSIEPKRDGVGDYVRRLAGELLKQGNHISVISLNDKYVKEPVDCKESINELDFSVLRLPFYPPSESQIDLVKKWINLFAPDFLSLQFVPFSFHKKGLPFFFSKYLKLFNANNNWHIMFHELWVGMAKESSLKLKIWGFVQKEMIKSMIKKLDPKCIHTNTSLYKQQLSFLGIDSKRLPLFSNIPRDKNYSGASETKSFPNSSAPVYLVLFGLIHPGAPVEQFAKEIGLFCKEVNLEIILRIIGRNGNEQPHWENAWKSEGLKSEIYGEQPVEKISFLLSTSHIGITTNPISIVEKSGTVAAMMEHELPVLSVAKNWHLPAKIKATEIQGVLPYSIENFKFYIKNKQTSPGCNLGVSKIAELFIHDLSSVLQP